MWFHCLIFNICKFSKRVDSSGGAMSRSVTGSETLSVNAVISDSWVCFLPLCTSEHHSFITSQSLLGHICVFVSFSFLMSKWGKSGLPGAVLYWNDTIAVLCYCVNVCVVFLLVCPSASFIHCFPVSLLLLVSSFNQTVISASPSLAPHRHATFTE